MAYSVTDGKGSSILAVSGAMIALSTVAVALRFWGRYIAHKNVLWWDDWLSLAALPFVWAICALSIYWVYIGLGQHIVHVHTSHARLGLVLFIVDIMYNTGLTLVKLSVLLFYARVFRTVRSYRISFWIVGFMIVAWCIAIDFVAVFACIPVQRGWDSSVPGHCLDRQANFVGAAIPNILTDFILLVLPMPMLWHIQTTIRRKVALVGVFAAGYLVLVISILRFVFIARDGTTLNKDLTWNGVTSEILLICEVSIALVSSCIPNIFHLAKHAVETGFSRLSGKSGNPNKAGGSRVNFRMETVRRSIQERRNGSLKQLQGAPKSFADTSNERLFGTASDRMHSHTTHESETA